MNLLLLPLAWVYGSIIRVRNMLFDLGVLKTKEFTVPTIAIGNLRVGGTGKTPMAISLLGLLQGDYRMAVLSRGYGRNTEGWVEVSEDAHPENTGDEPLLIKRAMPGNKVAVMEDRVRGVEMLLAQDPSPEVILLDDAMQHRYVKPGHLILLTAYHARYTHDYLLPVGRLREHRASAMRADTIVVTKCPRELTPHERHDIEYEIGPKAHQVVCFAYEEYPGLTELASGKAMTWDAFGSRDILLVTGLADTITLEQMLSDRGHQIKHIQFRDHHAFSASDMERINTQFKALHGGSPAILTTEKDAIRIAKWMQNQKFAALPVYAIRHRMKWFEKDQEIIENRLDEFITAYSRNS